MLSNKLAKQLRMGSEVIMEFLRKLCEGAQQKRIRGRLRVWATGLAKARKHTHARVRGKTYAGHEELLLVGRGHLDKVLGGRLQTPYAAAVVRHR